MADIQLLSVDAARYSSRHKTWRRTTKSAKMVLEHLPSTIELVTWNVDFSAALAKPRLKAALTHIQDDVLMCKGGERPPPCCILLQEILKVGHNVEIIVAFQANSPLWQEAFRTILDNEWLQQYFIVAPRKLDEWPPGAHYGNVTLVSRTVPVSGVYSLEYDSHMNRNALFVDLKLSVPAAPSRVVTLRVGNTHLESLPIPGAAMRPAQLGLVAEVLREEDLIGGIVCGDMNAISPSDIGLTEKVGLADAFEDGEEEEEDGYTWGYQPPCEFAPGRLDKILFTPGAGGYEVEQPQRIGLALKTDKGQWVSDHYGLVTTVRIME